MSTKFFFGISRLRFFEKSFSDYPQVCSLGFSREAVLIRENPKKNLVICGGSPHEPRDIGNHHRLSSTMNQHPAKGIALERNLRHTLEWERFLLYFQPKVDGDKL